MNTVLVMLAAYCVINVNYPRVYAMYMAVMQSLVLDEPYVKATSKKYAFLIRKLMAGFRGSYRQRGRGGWAKCQEDDSPIISCVNYHNEHTQREQLLHTRLYVVAATWFGILNMYIMLLALHFNTGVHLIRSVNVRATIFKVFISKCSSVWKCFPSWPHILRPEPVA